MPGPVDRAVPTSMFVPMLHPQVPAGFEADMHQDVALGHDGPGWQARTMPEAGACATPISSPYRSCRCPTTSPFSMRIADPDPGTEEPAAWRRCTNGNSRR